MFLKQGLAPGIIWHSVFVGFSLEVSEKAKYVDTRFRTSWTWKVLSSPFAIWERSLRSDGRRLYWIVGLDNHLKVLHTNLWSPIEFWRILLDPILRLNTIRKHQSTYASMKYHSIHFQYGDSGKSSKPFILLPKETHKDWLLFLATYSTRTRKIHWDISLLIIRSQINALIHRFSSFLNAEVCSLSFQFRYRKLLTLFSFLPAVQNVLLLLQHSGNLPINHRVTSAQLNSLSCSSSTRFLQMLSSRKKWKCRVFPEISFQKLHMADP